MFLRFAWMFLRFAETSQPCGDDRFPHTSGDHRLYIVGGDNRFVCGDNRVAMRPPCGDNRFASDGDNRFSWLACGAYSRYTRSRCGSRCRARTLSPVMAALLQQQLECVGRLLERMQGAELEQTANIQAAAFSASIAKLKKISADDKAELISAIRGSRFTDAAKRSLLEVLDSKSDGTSRKRSLQDYGAWPSFGTQPLWQQVARNPELSLELLVQHLNSLGLINPCKGTQKSIAAHVVCAEMADCPFASSPVEANDRFKKVGKRLKQLYKREPVEYITQLPATPASLLQMHPSTAKAVYSRECLPCACPLDPIRIAAVESQIQCRGPSVTASASSGESPQLSMQQMMTVMLRQLSVHMQASAGKQAAQLELFPPGTLAPAGSPPSKFAALADAARGPTTPPPRSDVGSPADVGGGGRDAAVGEGAPPRCLALVDGPVDGGPPDAKAAAMREAIVRSRAALIADRAKKTKDDKAANNCGDSRFTLL